MNTLFKITQDPKQDILYNLYDAISTLVKLLWGASRAQSFV